MRNKKMYSAVIGAFMVTLVPICASAQDYGATAVPIRARLEAVTPEKAKALREKIPVRAPEVKRVNTEVRPDTRRPERVTQSLKAIIDRFEAAIIRLETLAERIKARVALFEEKGLRVNDVSAKLDAADILIAQTKTELREASAAVEALLASETPRENLASVREALGKLQETIKQAHAALVEAITILKRNS